MERTMKSVTNASPTFQSAGISLFEGVLKMPLVKLPVRTALIELSTGKVLLSPHPALTIAEFQTMGEVTDIVAPNLFHHLGIEQAIAAHPQAKLWGVAGFEAKRKDLPWQHFLSETTWPYPQELIAIQIAGMPKLNEFVFFHPQSKTLFVTDLCFNIMDDLGFGGWLLYNIFGTYQRFAVSKILIKFVADPTAFRKSLETLFSYDFENIVMSHGLVVSGAGRAKLQAALQERGYSV
jgi:hypothetical protein